MSFDARATARILSRRYCGATALELLNGMLMKEMPGEVSVVSSFGAQSAVLLDLVSRVDPATPVIFINTGMMFGETLQYQSLLIERLGLRRVTSVAPRAELITDLDARGRLHLTEPDLCCFCRKVEPLERALGDARGWITGRKRFQSGSRVSLERIEAVDGRIKINPLADWTKAELEGYFEERALPRHPLEALGYLSIGCQPCTTVVAHGEGSRSGRWRGRDKVECGIHTRRV